MNRRQSVMIGSMISKKDIEKLASLARIQVTEEEKDQFAADIDSVLLYVDQIQKAPISLERESAVGVVKNVLREDSSSHESGMYTEKILNEAPKREGDYFKVKKIL